MLLQTSHEEGRECLGVYQVVRNQCVIRLCSWAHERFETPPPLPAPRKISNILLYNLLKSVYSTHVPYTNVYTSLAKSSRTLFFLQSYPVRTRGRIGDQKQNHGVLYKIRHVLFRPASRQQYRRRNSVGLSPCVLDNIAFRPKTLRQTRVTKKKSTTPLCIYKRSKSSSHKVIELVT